MQETRARGLVVDTAVCCEHMIYIQNYIEYISILSLYTSDQLLESELHLTASFYFDLILLLCIYKYPII